MQRMTEMAFMTEGKVERPSMEYSQGGSEVRRLHVVYFLSRNGHIEHPHLIRVHRLSRNGVHLRDVKRWLAELRGNDMPESFSWSYQRRYKTGHVWQDLLDDDLITPISDNEYILKGSEIISTTFDKEISYAKNRVSMQNKPSVEEEEEVVEDKKALEILVQSETSIDVSTEESTVFGSETSTLTDNSGKLEVEEKHSGSVMNEQDRSIQMEKKRKNKVKIEKIDTPATFTSSVNKSFESCYTKGTRNSSGGSHKFRSLLTCGALDTNDSAVVMINRKNNEISKGEKLGGSQRIFGSTSWNKQPWKTGRKSCDGVKDSKKNTGGFINQRMIRNAYKPLNSPNCSQCGKQFNPEKLHAHMKSCKGIKSTSQRLTNL